ncbi:MAG: glutamate racemase, partial [Verrucomicrobiota bacterium]|nr:glutamate racemase [Verrucomicrobiota bacterium]
MAANNDSRPIGVFDSGIGGLTVVSALRRALPNESIYYLGDTARVPYGGKSPTTVQRYSLEIASLLLGENAKTIVVACNTASALALPRLQETLPVSVTGVIAPGAQAAIAATRNGHIGVIGTRATIKSGAYERAIRQLNADVRVTARACPLLVPLIEEGWLMSD